MVILHTLLLGVAKYLDLWRAKEREAAEYINHIQQIQLPCLLRNYCSTVYSRPSSSSMAYSSSFVARDFKLFVLILPISFVASWREQAHHQLLCASRLALLIRILAEIHGASRIYPQLFDKAAHQ